ncbi:MAG: hypothetical protein ACR2PT_20540 [Endozoicomonas sp.]
MDTGGPDGPQNNGGGWLGLGGLGNLTSAFTSTLSGWFGGKETEATEGESYMASAGAKVHKLIDTRTVTGVESKTYEDLKLELMDALETCREDESRDPEELDIVRRGVLETCKGCLRRDDMNELLRNHRNFPDLFSNFPLDALLDKWREEQDIDPKLNDTEVFPERHEDWKEFDCYLPTKNLKGVRDQFQILYQDYMNDTEEFGSADGLQKSVNKPNTRVFTTRLALDYLAKADVKGFMDLYHTSHWLKSTLPSQFLEPLTKLSSKNLELDEVISQACKPLKHSDLYMCRDLPLSCAAMMQKNQDALFNLRDKIKAEIQSAKRDRSDDRSNSAQSALEALKEGRWDDLVLSMNRNSNLRGQPLVEVNRLLKEENHLAYVSQITMARIMTAYKSCLAEDTDGYFLHECLPTEIVVTDLEDHWTSKMKEGDYDIQMELFTALKDKKQMAAIEKALIKYMPGLVSGNPLA